MDAAADLRPPLEIGVISRIRPPSQAAHPRDCDAPPEHPRPPPRTLSTLERRQ